MIRHLLNRRLEHYRPSTAVDEGGGRSVTRAHIGSVKARVSAPTSRERQRSDGQDNEIDSDVYLLPTADVRRGDELHDGARVLWVDAVTAPSKTSYRLAECLSWQHEET